MSLSSLYAPVSEEFAQVTDCITHILSQTRLKTLFSINQFLLDNPGKRLRPLLCLLAFKAAAPTSPTPKSVIHVCAALELLHMASLIHDDVIDHAEIRHNKPSVHKQWGTEVAIPMGVYLYTLALRQISLADDNAVLRRISHAVKQLCEGELNQIFERGNSQLHLKKHLIILKKKTAVLFSTAAFCGATLAGATKAECFALQRVGHGLGMLFQISDDYMDVMGNTQTLGKTAGQDLAMGEVTLPLLFLLEGLPPEERQRTEALIQQQDPACLSQLQAQLRDSTALDRTKNLAIGYVDHALSQLKYLPESGYRDHLHTLILALQTRAFGQS